MKPITMGRPAAPVSASAGGGFTLTRILGWIQVAAERRRLAELDDRMLRDIGVVREDAKVEAARPFWDVPVGR